MALWRVHLVPYSITDPVLKLSFDGYCVQLLAEGGRFKFVDYKPEERLSENIFLTLPLREDGLSTFHKPDYKIQIYENVYKDVVP